MDNLDELLNALDSFVDARRRERLAKESPAYEVTNWSKVADEAKARLSSAFNRYIESKLLNGRSSG